jgi:ribosome-associated protein
VTRRKTTTDAREVAVLCARACDEKKGEDIAVLDVRNALKITDFFVIATGKNPRHLRGMADAMRKTARDLEVTVPREEGSDGEGRWLLLDFGDVIIHLFDREARRFYDLEHLWADVPRVAWQQNSDRKAL